MLQNHVRGLLRSAAVCTLLLFLTSPPPAAAVEFRIGGSSPQDAPVSISVPASGKVWLVLTATAIESAQSFELELTPFRNPRGQASPVGFVVEGDRIPAPGKIVLPAAGRHVLQLDVTGLALGDTYEGELLVAVKDVETQVFSLKLATARTVYQSVGDGMRSVDVRVPSDGIASFYFDAPAYGTDSGEVRLELSPFIDEASGREVTVLFVHGDTNAATAFTSTLEQGRQLIRLDASRIGVGATYDGELSLAIAGVEQPPVRLRLTRNPAENGAALAVGQPVAVAITCHWWSCNPPPIQVDLRESSGVATLMGLGLTTVSGDQNQGGINPIDDLAIELIRATDETKHCSGDLDPGRQFDLWRHDPSDSDASVNLAAGSRATLCIRFLRDLEPGEYSIPIRVTALNVAADAANIITIGLKVTRSEIWPFMTLLLSVLASYGLTKMIRTQLQRSALQNRIAKIRNQTWYRKKTSIVPMVQVKAMLSQVSQAMDFERPGKPFFFPASLAEHVTAVEKRLQCLKRLTDLIRYWDRSNEDDLLINRANKELGAVTYALNDTPLDEEIDAGIVTRLSTLEEWRDSTKLRGHYWNSLYGDILTITRQINWSEFASADLSPFLAELNRYPDLDGVKARLAEISACVDALKSMPGRLNSQQDDLLNDTDSAVRGLIDDFGTAMAASFATVRHQLELVDDIGPEPAIDAVDMLRRQMHSSALQSKLSHLRNFMEALNAKAIADSGPERQLAECLRSFEIYDEGVVSELTGKLEAALTRQQSSDRETLRSLEAALRPDEAPKNLTEALERERCYCKVKLIVQAKGDVRGALLDAERRGESLRNMFEMMDDASWELVCKGISLTSVPKSPGAFELVEFVVTASDEDAEKSFLFKHGLTYRWRIWFEKPERKDTEPDLDVTTNAPRVTQFIPIPSSNPVVSVVARYRRGAEPVSAALKDGLRVSTARIFGVVAAFERVELAALGLAIFAALGTGMQSQQYQAAINGSLSAYWVLIAWGFAADQIKNVLENIKTFTSPDA